MLAMLNIAGLVRSIKRLKELDESRKRVLAEIEYRTSLIFGEDYNPLVTIIANRLGITEDEVENMPVGILWDKLVATLKTKGDI